MATGVYQKAVAVALCGGRGGPPTAPPLLKEGAYKL